MKKILLLLFIISNVQISNDFQLSYKSVSAGSCSESNADACVTPDPNFNPDPCEIYGCGGGYLGGGPGNPEAGGGGPIGGGGGTSGDNSGGTSGSSSPGTITPEEQCVIDATEAHGSCKTVANGLYATTAGLCVGFAPAMPAVAVCEVAAAIAFSDALTDCEVEFEEAKALCN